MFGSSVHLEEADFTEAKMRKVILNEAFLNGAKMKKVDLTDAQVQNVDFSPHTTETGTPKYDKVDLEDSTLTRADFSNSDVEGVDFDGAKVLGTKWDGARNLNPKRSMTMGVSKNSGEACTFPVFKLPARKVKTETPSKTMFKHTSAVFKSVAGGEGDDESDSGGSSEDDSDDNSGEEIEDEDEEEKLGLLSKIADGVQYVVSQLDQITKEVHPFYTEKSEKLKVGALAADKVLEEVKSIKDRARTLDTESAVAQVLHKALTDLAGTPIHICLAVRIHENPKSRPESGCFSHQR
jgi:hypothetical protein